MSVYSLSFPGKYDLVCLRDSLSQTPEGVRKFVCEALI